MTVDIIAIKERKSLSFWYLLVVPITFIIRLYAFGNIANHQVGYVRIKFHNHLML